MNDNACRSKAWITQMFDNSLILGLNDSTQIKAQTIKAKSDKILVQNIGSGGQGFGWLNLECFNIEIISLNTSWLNVNLGQEQQIRLHSLFFQEICSHIFCQ